LKSLLLKDFDIYFNKEYIYYIREIEEYTLFYNMDTLKKEIKKILIQYGHYQRINLY